MLPQKEIPSGILQRFDAVCYLALTAPLPEFCQAMAHCIRRYPLAPLHGHQLLAVLLQCRTGFERLFRVCARLPGGGLQFQRD